MIAIVAVATNATTMKMLLLALLASATLPIAALALPVAASTTGAARAHLVGTVGDYVERGTYRIQVLAKLGDPAGRLAPDVWVYRRFAPQESHRGVAGDCRTLLIFFRDGVVAEMRLVNPAAERLIAADLRARTASRVVASSGGEERNVRR